MRGKHLFLGQPSGGLNFPGYNFSVRGSLLFMIFMFWFSILISSNRDNLVSLCNRSIPFIIVRSSSLRIIRIWLEGVFHCRYAWTYALSPPPQVAVTGAQIKVSVETLLHFSGAQNSPRR